MTDPNKLMLAGAFLDRIGRSSDTKRGPEHMIDVLDEYGIKVKKFTQHARGVGLWIDKHDAEQHIDQHDRTSSRQDESQLHRIERKLDALLAVLGITPIGATPK